MRISRNCLICAVSFTVIPSILKKSGGGSYCSNECRFKAFPLRKKRAYSGLYKDIWDFHMLDTRRHHPTTISERFSIERNKVVKILNTMKKRTGDNSYTIRQVSVLR